MPGSIVSDQRTVSGRAPQATNTDLKPCLGRYHKTCKGALSVAPAGRKMADLYLASSLSTAPLRPPLTTKQRRGAPTSSSSSCLRRHVVQYVVCRLSFVASLSSMLSFVVCRCGAATSSSCIVSSPPCRCCHRRWKYTASTADLPRLSATLPPLPHQRALLMICTCLSRQLRQSRPTTNEKRYVTWAVQWTRENRNGCRHDAAASTS